MITGCSQSSFGYKHYSWHVTRLIDSLTTIVSLSSSARDLDPDKQQYNYRKWFNACFNSHIYIENSIYQQSKGSFILLLELIYVVLNITLLDTLTRNYF